MISNLITHLKDHLRTLVLSVPIRVKIIGIGLLPVVILGLSLNYWVTSGLSDWLSHLLNEPRVEAAMAAGSRSVIFVTILFAILSIFLAYLFTFLLTRPILELRKTAKEVARGNFDSRAEVWASDEIGSLAVSINKMIDNFVENKNNLLRINQQLELTNAISQAAEDHQDIHDCLYQIIRRVQSYLDFEFGWVYLYDPEINRHHLASWFGVPDPYQKHLLNSNAEQLCSCQKKLVSGDLSSPFSVMECERLTPLDSKMETFQHTTIPIIHGETYYGMINLFFSDLESLDEEKRDYITNSFSSQTSKIVANAWYKIKLKEKEAARQILLESLVTAQEDERLRLARELHDQTGQTLTNLLIRLQTIERKSSQKEIKTELKTTQNYVSEAIETVRDISYSLRPPVLEEFGLGAAIQDLLSSLTHQIPLSGECRCNLENPLPQEIEVMLYRIVQEALTNVVRHAEATQVTVDLKMEENILTLSIQDNGKGFDPAEITVDDENNHLGLLSMNERADLIGGSFNIVSELGKGTRIQITVPS